jgi:hypothetical protein
MNTVFLQSRPVLISSTFLFKGQAARARGIELHQREALGNMLRNKLAIPGKALAAAEAWPTVCSYLGAAMMEHPQTAKLLLEDAACALFAIYGNPTLAPALENSIMGSGEALCEYLVFIERTKTSPSMPYERLRAALLDEAYWGYQYFKQTQDRVFLGELLDRCEANKHNSPGAALIWLLGNEAESAQPFEESLHSSPLYAYVASQCLSTRGFDLQIDRVKGVDARWACHFLLLNMEKFADALAEKLERCPGWSIEYVIRSGGYQTVSFMHTMFTQWAHAARLKKLNEVPPSDAVNSSEAYLGTAIQWREGYVAYANSFSHVKHITEGLVLDPPPRAGGLPTA